MYVVLISANYGVPTAIYNTAELWCWNPVCILCYGICICKLKPVVDWQAFFISVDTTLL